MRVAARAALARLHARGGRTLLSAVGIAAAAAMLGTAVTVSVALATGFERSAERADLPSLTARFDDARVADVDRRVASLPNLQDRSYRYEAKGVRLSARGGSSERGAVQVVRGGRRGYAVVEGRDLSGAPDEVLVERGVATEWGLRVGERLRIGEIGARRVVGIASSPDSVAFPLSSDPRVYLSYQAVAARFGPFDDVNMALVWVNDPARLDVTLEQARAVSFGISNLRFLTERGVRLLVDQAAGIVIALLVAFSLVALASAALMLAAGARAEVERRMATVGVLRAIGFSRAGVAGEYALEAVIVAVPAGIIGLAVGALVAGAPTARVLESLNQAPP